MAQMIIRNIPDDVLAAFKEAARARGVSQEEAARQLIEQTVAEDRARAGFLRQVESIRAKFREEGRTFGDSTKIVRRMRDSR